MEDPNEEEEAAHLPTEASVKLFQQTDGTKTNTIQDCHEMKIENIESYETKYSETDTSIELRERTLIMNAIFGPFLTPPPPLYAF